MYTSFTTEIHASKSVNQRNPPKRRKDIRNNLRRVDETISHPSRPTTRLRRDCVPGGTRVRHTAMVFSRPTSLFPSVNFGKIVFQ